MTLCDYGCGKEGTFVLSSGKRCCSSHYNKCESVRKKNSLGLKKCHKEGRKVSFTKEQQRNSILSHRKNLMSKPFEEWGKRLRKDFLLEEQNGKCLWCELDTWLGKQITLQVDHVDGNTDNNKRINLRLLCPNCHSQTETFCGKNSNSGKKKISDKDLLETYNKSNSINECLVNCKLKTNKGNYNRVRKLLGLLVER